MNKKRQQWKPGDVVKISLGNGEWGFGRVLGNPLMAFYDYKSSEIPPLEEIVLKPIAFKTWVMKYAITKGEFPVVGHMTLSPELLERPLFFMQDPLNGKLSITYDGGERWAATRSEIEGLERAAVSDPEHIVDRLNDHFAGLPDRWAVPLKPEY